MTGTLHTKYRPQTFDEVVGNQDTVQSVRTQLNRGSQRSFLFHGEPGTGKTTLARLIARHVGALEHNVTEFNAGHDTGIDAVRGLIEQSAYRGMGEVDKKVFVLDEVHMLSKQAWNAMLKTLEEPPEWLYWCLCTTEVKKVPKSVVTRCSTHRTEQLAPRVIRRHLETLCQREGITALPGETLQKIAEHAEGSLRQAITSLSACRDLSTTDQVLATLSVLSETETDVIELCRGLNKAHGFSEIQPLLGNLPKDTNPESVRRVILSYFSKVALNVEQAYQYERAARVLEAFITPYDATTGLAPLICSCVRLFKPKT